MPGTPLDERTRAEMELPRTLLPVPGEGVLQRPVFDPALKHYMRAMKAGDPEFADRETAVRWYEARAVAFDHVLAAIAGSRWADHLMLRGSVLLAAWFGPAARPPGDLDFVVVPRSWTLEDGRTGRMFDDLARLAEDVSQRNAGEVRLCAGEAVSDEIWTYDRVPGRRLVLPWRAEGLPAGSVQLDFVFGEPLVTPPVPTALPRPGGGSLTLLAATPGQSLAWKILWLVSDMYPQAKDLYDAMLLAETATVDARLLRETFVAADAFYARRLPGLEELAVALREVDWEEFRTEYPDAPPVSDPQGERLLALLAPAFTAQGETSGSAYEQRVFWLGPRIEEGRRLLAERGREDFLRFLTAEGSRISDAALIANEVLGRPAGDIDATAGELLAEPLWSRFAGYYRRDPARLEEELAPLRG